MRIQDLLNNGSLHLRDLLIRSMAGSLPRGRPLSTRPSA
jgi:hypothetical protein